MKKILTNTSVLCALMALLSACSEQKPDISTIAKSFADMECRAINLKNQRYALADQMRFIQDTIIADTSSDVTKARLSEQLKALDMGKDDMVNHGLSLADTIQQTLASLIKGPLKNVEDRHKFDELLAQELQKRGCK